MNWCSTVRLCSSETSYLCLDKRNLEPEDFVKLKKRLLRIKYLSKFQDLFNSAWPAIESQIML